MTCFYLKMQFGKCHFAYLAKYTSLSRKKMSVTRGFGFEQMCDVSRQ